MIHVLNNLTSDYELQMVLLVKRIGNEKTRLKLMNYVSYHNSRRNKANGNRNHNIRTGAARITADVMLN
jgi:hypothetical protein